MAPSTLQTWFKSGTVAPDGEVTADSINFVGGNECDFYTWSERMFLWLTSPAPPSYGGAGRIFQSPTFYTVSPAGPNKVRTMTKMSGSGAVFVVRNNQAGPHDLPLLRGRNNILYELAPTPIGPHKLQEVQDATGRLVEVSRAARVGVEKVALFDVTGKPIALPATPRTATAIGRIQNLSVGNETAQVDMFGTIVHAEQAEADDAVAMAQNGSLIYYTIAVNDVYAYFRTGVANGDLQAANFPDSQAAMMSVTDYAWNAKYIAFPDPEAMAVEVKMAWVEAVNLPAGCNYITMQAVIPTYAPDPATQPLHAAQSGHRTATMALISVHVVGSANGQPAMIWATFEHVCNAPNPGYVYATAQGAMQGPTETGPWLLSSSDSPAPPNVQRMSFNLSAAAIDALPGKTIGPSDLERLMPWGQPGTDQSKAMINGRVIAVNDSVRSQIAGDVRADYILTGTTWFQFGSGGIWPDANNFHRLWTIAQAGTTRLANTAIETYLQGMANCLDCHTNDSGVGGTSTNQPFDPVGNLGYPNGKGLSRIFGELTPLYPP